MRASKIERKISYLVDRNIIYKKDPSLEDDILRKKISYDWGTYYPDGVYGYYNLFSNKSKIYNLGQMFNTFWTLRYCNPNMDIDAFYKLCYFISARDNGFCIFDVKPEWINQKVEEILEGNFLYERPPSPLRKFIFKQSLGLSAKQRMAIASSVSNSFKSKVDASDIYEIMLQLHDEGRKVTIKLTANLLNVHIRTINRWLKKTPELKKAKNEFNDLYKQEQKL
jgi:hypothetical protein